MGALVFVAVLVLIIACVVLVLCVALIDQQRSALTVASSRLRRATERGAAASDQLGSRSRAANR